MIIEVTDDGSWGFERRLSLQLKERNTSVYFCLIHSKAQQLLEIILKIILIIIIKKRNPICVCFFYATLTPTLPLSNWYVEEINAEREKTNNWNLRSKAQTVAATLMQPCLARNILLYHLLYKYTALLLFYFIFLSLWSNAIMKYTWILCIPIMLSWP